MRIDPSFPYLDNTSPAGVGNTPAQPKIPAAATPAANDAESSATDAGDTVELSRTASQAQQLAAQLAQTPEVRAGRVAALQQQIQQGTYQPGNEQIASAMLAELFGAGGQG